MIQCLKQFCIEGCRWVLCWHCKQDISGNDNSKNRNQQWEHQTNKLNYYCIVASLSHDLNFNKLSQISKDQPITCHHRHRSISPFILNLVTRQGWAVNNTFSHIMPRKEPPTTHCNEGWWAPGRVYTSMEKIKSLASTVFWTPQYVTTLSAPSCPLQSPIRFKWTINHCSENLFSFQPDHVKRWL